ncbi:MAG: aminotransferase class IV [Verrucomicrobiae bacterium]|nr:aminotransferase class IV [Verrucomicrobiae bacterium]
MIVYHNGRFLPKDEVYLSPDDRGFLFGDGAYEVVRASKGRLFRAAAHWQRLQHSLSAIEIQYPTPTEQLDHVAAALLNQNQLAAAEATVYLQVTRGVALRKHSYPHPPVATTVYGFAAPFVPPREKCQAGVGVITVPDQRWSRCDLKVISLLPNVLANQQAQAAGAQEAVFVRDGVITEGSHTNFAAVREGALLTHPESCVILSGITRRAVLELCDELHVPILEVPLRESELESVDEAMLLGTTSDVMPVIRINEQQIGVGRPGPVTRRLQQAFHELFTRETSPNPDSHLEPPNRSRRCEEADSPEL